MANREACELYIEQEIKDGLEQGKKPYSIGKELSAWIEKLFEVNIHPKTIATRVYRHPDFSSNEEKKSQPLETITNSEPPQITSVFLQDRHPQGGGVREGAGRPISDESIDKFLEKAKRLAKLAQKIKSAPSFEERKRELISAANLVAIVLTETRGDIKWV